jgi:hypothetical protein
MAKAFLPKDPERLQRFLNRRKLDTRVVDMLKAAKTAHDLKKGEVTVAQSATYAKLTEDLIKAVNQGWIGRDDVVAMLDESEVAGRQHVCIFQLPSTGQKKILEALRAPHSVYTGPVSLDDFYEVPSQTMARILKDTSEEVVVKIIAKRTYWLSEILKDNPEEQLIRRYRERERSAIIVKCNVKDGLFQVRVQPREKGQADTSKNVFDFMMETMKAHYDVGKTSWFDQLAFFPIGDSFPKLLKNRTDFVLWYDSPENNDIRAQLYRRGSHVNAADLRDDPHWSYGKGFSRNSIRCIWKLPGGDVFMHLNQDEVRLDPQTTFNIARIFVPGLCDDRELDNAIRRIRDHL